MRAMEEAIEEWKLGARDGPISVIHANSLILTVNLFPSEFHLRNRASTPRGHRVHLHTNTNGSTHAGTVCMPICAHWYADYTRFMVCYIAAEFTERG